MTEPAARHPRHPRDIADESFRTARIRLATFLFVCMVGSLAAWWIRGDLSASGLQFITIPGSMAILMAALPGANNETSYGIWRGTTIAILASAILVREGFICVLLALPLILPVVALVAWLTRPASSKRFKAVLLPVLLLGFGAEGAVFDLPNQIEASETRVVDSTSAELNTSLEARATLPELEPVLFALPFPRPTGVVGEGSDVGDHRIVEFGEDGHMTLQVTARTDDSVTWTTIEDTTPIAGWMAFDETTASWNETPDGLELTVTIGFERKLSPALYFDPLQRWGVGEMAEVLVDMIEHNLQTPAAANQDV